MKKYNFLKRILQILIVLFGISFLTFLLIYMAPGDPVLNLMLARLWPTLQLALTSLVLMLAVAVPFGIISAIHKGGAADYIVRGFIFLGVSMPNFWVGLLLLYVFAVQLDLLPVVSSGQGFEKMILPAVTPAFVMAAKYTRQVRTAFLEELNQDYVTGARCRGIPEHVILWKHVLPNSILPLITMLGLSFGSLLGGTAVVEVIFSYPGLGNLAVDAITAMDYPLIQAYVLWIALIYMVLNLLVGAAVFAHLLAPYDPYEAVLADAVQPPSSEHWFGTDRMGRDLFSRVIYGARTSLAAALSLVGIIVAAGTFLGIIAGYFGGILDAVIMRISDMMISFPGMVLAIAVAGILGASIGNAVIAIAIVSWTKYARLARSLVLKIYHQDYIAAARVTGSKTSHILWKYMLPNGLPTILITGATDIGSMMLEIAGLSFLGFGAQPPAAEWGYMLNEGRAYITAAPWLMIFPGLAIFITVVIFNLLGDSLRDVLDPRDE